MAELRAKMMVKDDVVRETAEALGLRTKKLQRRISWEEFNERWFKGLCMFCNELETPDHHLLHKNSGILMIDCDEEQSSYDRELVESEVATESIKTEHGTVKREANADMILANLKDESMPHFQVPVSDSEILKNVELKEENSVFKNLAYVVKNENLDLRFEVEGDVERGQKVQGMEKIRSAHQVFGKMSRHETLGIKKKTKGFKSWRFKFKQRKQQRGKLRSAHQLIHRRNVMYKYLCSSAKVALMKKNKFSITWPTIKDDCFMEDDQVYWETLPLWLLVRFKFWKFKFKNKGRFRRFQSFSRLVLLALINLWFRKAYKFSGQLQDSSNGKDESFSFLNFAAEQPLLWMQNNAERILIVSKLERKKKKLCYKTWMFKYKVDEEDQGILQSRTGWVQEVSDVIRFLLRRHLHLNLDCEEPELAGRKRNHGLFIRLHNKLKQQRCPKSWMFKFKTDSQPARTNHILHQEKKPNEFEQVVKHTPFSVVKLGKPKDHDALLLLLSGDESFQIKHKWRFKTLAIDLRVGVIFGLSCARH